MYNKIIILILLFVLLILSVSITLLFKYYGGLKEEIINVQGNKIKFLCNEPNKYNDFSEYKNYGYIDENNKFYSNLKPQNTISYNICAYLPYNKQILKTKNIIFKILNKIKNYFKLSKEDFETETYNDIFEINTSLFKKNKNTIYQSYKFFWDYFINNKYKRTYKFDNIIYKISQTINIIMNPFIFTILITMLFFRLGDYYYLIVNETINEDNYYSILYEFVKKTIIISISPENFNIISKISVINSKNINKKIKLEYLKNNVLETIKVNNYELYKKIYTEINSKLHNMMSVRTGKINLNSNPDYLLRDYITFGENPYVFQTPFYWISYYGEVFPIFLSIYELVYSHIEEPKPKLFLIIIIINIVIYSYKKLFKKSILHLPIDIFNSVYNYIINYNKNKVNMSKIFKYMYSKKK